MLHTAVIMTNHHNFINAQFINCNQKTAHNTVKRQKNHAAGIFNQLYVTVFNAQCGWQQFGEACIHTCNNSDVSVGIFAGVIFLILFFGYKGFVVFQHFFHHSAHKIPPPYRTSITCFSGALAGSSFSIYNTGPSPSYSNHSFISNFARTFIHCCSCSLWPFSR